MVKRSILLGQLEKNMGSEEQTPKTLENQGTLTWEKILNDSLLKGYLYSYHLQLHIYPSRQILIIIRVEKLSFKIQSTENK